MTQDAEQRLWHLNDNRGIESPDGRLLAVIVDANKIEIQMMLAAPELLSQLQRFVSSFGAFLHSKTKRASHV